MIPRAISSLLNFNNKKNTPRFNSAPNLRTFPKIPDCKIKLKSVNKLNDEKKFKNKKPPKKAVIKPIKKPISMSVYFI